MAETLEFESIAERLNTRLAEMRGGYDGHVSHLAAELLNETSREIGGFGEEGILDAEKGIDIQYINMGDAYNETILYDGAQNRFFAGAWGDVVEKYEAEYQAKHENASERMLRIAETLNEDRRKTEFWMEKHGYSTVEEVMEELLSELDEADGERVHEIYDRTKDMEILYIDRRNDLENTLVYDAVLDFFSSEPISEVLKRKEREYETEHAMFGSIARRLNRELAEFDGLDEKNGNERSDVIRDMLRGVLNEVRGERVGESVSGRITRVERSGQHSHTIFYDANTDKFHAGDWTAPPDEMNREMSGPDDQTRDAGMDALHLAAKEGLSVYIGGDEYYVRSTNKYFANLYPMKDIDALPWQINGWTIDWDALKKDPYSLAGEIRSNEFRVTDYFLDIDDFRDAVIGNTRNAAVIERMNLAVPERDEPLIPVLQTDASPYYTVGSKVFLSEDRQAEILAIGNGRVWYSYEREAPQKVLTDSRRRFSDIFFANPLNGDAIERAREIERSDEKQLISSINLPALAERLNLEREDIKAWETAHPDKTVHEWLDEISKEIRYASAGPLGQPPKGADLWRINLRGRDESLFYDYIDQKFLYGKTSDVMKQKEAEHAQYLERLDSLAERLNGRIPDFRESGAPNMSHYVTDLLAEANREIRGDGVFTSEDAGRGVYVRYADKHGNPYIPTILYDGRGGRFRAGSRHDLEQKQHAEYELANFGDIAAKNNARMAKNEGMSDEDRDAMVYRLLGESMVSMGGGNISVMYQKDKGPVIDYVDIEERRPFTLIYDRESQTFLVDDPNELLKEKERRVNERESSAPEPAKPENSEKPYSLNYGHMGNGLVVWNRLEERDGDYVKVAHIDPDRKVTFYDKNMPEAIKREITGIARTSDARISATQDARVFNTPPSPPGHFPVFYGKAGEDKEAYSESNRQNIECARAMEKAIRDHYDGSRLDAAKTLEDLKGYSAERITVVLASTLRSREGDGRFSSDNMQWQRNIVLPESALAHNTTIDSHSVIVNYLVTNFRKIEMDRFNRPEQPEREMPGSPEPSGLSEPERAPDAVPEISDINPPANAEPDTPTGAADTPETAAPVKSVLNEIDWPKPRSKTEEFRQEFTKKIISLMEQGKAFWQKPWDCPGNSMPVNAVSGNRYNGINIAYLMISSIDKGYSDPRWMTYKQAEEQGYHVKRGEHGTKIEYYGEYDPSKTKKGAELLDKKIQEMMIAGASQEAIEKAAEEQKTLYVKTYTVFNASQIEGIEPLETAPPGTASDFRHHDRAEAIMDNCGVPIKYGMSYAAYNTGQDIIKMPSRENFSTPEYFYSTVLHEIAHSTGHHSRMNREGLGKPFGSPEYAKEELRAEMASAFVFQEIGMPLSEDDMEGHVKDHAAYTQFWLDSLKNDYKEFYKAARDAAKIADYTLAYERAHAKTNTAQTEIPPVTEAAYKPVADPVQAAKSAIGRNAIVTNAQAGKTYTGEIVSIEGDYAVQKIASGRGIVHDLHKIADRSELTGLFSLQKDGEKISISYDGKRNASVKTQSRDEERESAVTR